MNYYEVLGIKRDATEKEIRDSYFDSVFKLLSYDELKAKDEAYMTLIDPNKRLEYDKKIFDKSVSLEQEKEKSNISEKSNKIKAIELVPSTTLEETARKLIRLKNNGINAYSSFDGIRMPNWEFTNVDEVIEYYNMKLENIQRKKNESIELILPLNYDKKISSKTEFDSNKSYENEFKSQEMIKPIIKNENKQLNNYSALKDVVFGTKIGMGVSVGYMVLGPVGAFVGASVAIYPRFYKKISNWKVERKLLAPKIEDLKNLEIMAAELSTQSLNERINILLKGIHNNYDLEICKERYKENIKLLKYQLELKQSFKVKKGRMFRLEQISMNLKINELEQKLKNIESKISLYDKSQSLTRINMELNEVNNSIKNTDVSEFNLQILKIKKEFLEFAQKHKIKGIKLVNNSLNTVKKIVLTPINKVDNLYKTGKTYFEEEMKKQR